MKLGAAVLALELIADRGDAFSQDIAQKALEFIDRTDDQEVSSSRAMTAAERARKYRAKSRDPSREPSRKPSRSVTKNVTERDGDAGIAPALTRPSDPDQIPENTENLAKETRGSFSGGGLGEPLFPVTETVTNAVTRIVTKRVTQTRRSMPSDPADVREFCTAWGIDMGHPEWPHFVEHYQASGVVWKRWDLVWKKWLRNAPAFASKTPSRAPNALPPWRAEKLAAETAAEEKAARLKTDRKERERQYEERAREIAAQEQHAKETAQ